MQNNFDVAIRIAGKCTCPKLEFGLFLIVCIFFWFPNIAIAQVGIGTNNPDSNAVLDLTSTNKGVLLPRVNDTSSVSNPSAGLLIFNKNTNTPAFHNGISWNTLNSTNNLSSENAVDSITYTISGPGSTGYFKGTLPVNALSIGGSNGGPPGQPSVNWQDISFTKPSDYNSTTFLSNLATGELTGMVEFNIFVTGSSGPRFSIKLTNWFVSSSQLGVSIGDGFELTESVSLTYGTNGTIGFKDWVNNKGFSYSLSSKTVGPY